MIAPTIFQIVGFLMVVLFGLLLIFMIGCMIAELDDARRNSFFITTLLLLLGIALLFV